ncbi:hypothetical protein BJV78DRAFT_1186579 [Lactifluus subvellereus]|nr:hypothetical protein BJV78DRAFT_1186579 [Lactifluus subvellereus]
MDPLVNISPPIALAGVLSGILLVSLSVLLVHFVVLLRRRAKQSPLQYMGALRLNRHQTALRPRDQWSDSDSSDLDQSQSSLEKGSRASASLNLKPNQPVFVDVKPDNGSQAGLQLILTPPTPTRSRQTALATVAAMSLRAECEDADTEGATRVVS